MKKKPPSNKDEEQEDGEDGSTGGAGGGLIPSYYELLGLTSDEKELIPLVADALREIRIDVKRQGYDVTALSKIQKLRSQLSEPGLDNSADGASVALEDHPELAEMGGDIDPNIVVLPESEDLAAARDAPRLSLAAKARYKQKMELRNSPKPEPDRPRYRPSNAPKPRPF